jgi:hypothetical protein
VVSEKNNPITRERLNYFLNKGSKTSSPKALECSVYQRQGFFFPEAAPFVASSPQATAIQAPSSPVSSRHWKGGMG